MWFTKTPLPLLALWLSFLLLITGGPLAVAQSTSEAEEEAESARRSAAVAKGLVDEAVANRSAIEAMLIESITRLNELGSQLSAVGAVLDGLAARLGFADVELAGIQAEIETQAVQSYMTVLSSPSVAWVSTGSVEHALVASSVVEDVVAAGQTEVDELVVKRRSLVSLQDQYLAKQAEFARLQQEMDAEVERFTDIYEQADQEVAAAVRQAREADAAYRAALSAVDVAQAKESERVRQEARSTTPGSTPTTNPPGTSPATTAAAAPTTTAGSGGGGSWDHPPAVERWRSLVETFFPSHRVEEALRIIDCESNGDPDAYNPYSGASGLFQFIPGTWATTSTRAGYPGASVFDPEANVASAAWLANEYQRQGQYYWQAWNCSRVLG
ncbi:MAG: transglycosylase SLT domain-containing protein [Acidimicrobiia bacterium]